MMMMMVMMMMIGMSSKMQYSERVDLKSLRGRPRHSRMFAQDGH
jgi:hypothetical protein